MYVCTCFNTLLYPFPKSNQNIKKVIFSEGTEVKYIGRWHPLGSSAMIWSWINCQHQRGGYQDNTDTIIASHCW